MDFTLDTEQEALRDAVKEMVGRRETDDEPGSIAFDADLWKQYAEMGLLGLPFAEESGGMGAGPVEVMVVAQMLGRARARSPYAEALLAGWVLEATGGHGETLEAISEGSAVVLPALVEPGRAWSLRAHGVTATEADGGWTLTGVKAPVPYAGAATHLLVSADTGSGTGLFLVQDAKVEGTTVTLDGTAGIALGDADAGVVLEQAVARANVALLSEALGTMEAAVDMTVAYLKTRKQFGVPLMSFQALTHRAADLYVAVELTRSAVQLAAMTMAEDPSDTDAVSRARVVLGRHGRLVAQEAIQLHGGIGMTAEYAVGHLSTRLTEIERSLGDTRWHLARLALSIRDHDTVALL